MLIGRPPVGQFLSAFRQPAAPVPLLRQLALGLLTFWAAWAAPPTARGQQAPLQWAGGWTIPSGPHMNGFDELNDMTIDGAGNLYLVGEFAGTAQFGNGVTATSVGPSDTYLVKYSPTGVCRWVVTGGHPVFGDPTFRHVAVDRHGNAYVAGNSAGVGFTTPCGVVTQPAGTLDGGVLLKVDSTGQCAWQRPIAGGSSSALAIDSVGGVYVGGLTYDPIVLDTLHLPNRTYAVWVAKLDSAGNGQWIRKAGNGTNSPSLMGLVAAPGGGVFAAGQWEWNTAVPFRFTPTLSVSNAPLTLGGGFLAKLDGAGNWRWAKGTTGCDASFIRMTLSRQGQLFLSGGAGIGTFNFGGVTAPIPAGQGALCLMRCDTAGTVHWLQAALSPLSGGTGVGLAGLTTDARGDLLAVGFVSDRMELPGLSQPLVSVGPSDALVLRFSGATGLVTGVVSDSAAGPGELRPTSIAYAGPGGVLIAGAVLGGPVRIGTFTLPAQPNNSDSFVARVQDGVLGRREAAPSAAGFTLWPNPARHTARLQVAVAPAQALPVQLYDALGRVVLRATVAAGHTTAALPLAGLAPGIYLVRAGNRSQRLVVE